MIILGRGLFLVYCTIGIVIAFESITKIVGAGVKIKIILVVFMLLVNPNISFASPGGLDKYGCHTESSTGNYHCHNSGTSSSSSNSGDYSTEEKMLALFIVAGLSYWYIKSNRTMKHSGLLQGKKKPDFIIFPKINTDQVEISVEYRM